MVSVRKLRAITALTIPSAPSIASHHICHTRPNEIHGRFFRHVVIIHTLFKLRSNWVLATGTPQGVSLLHQAG